MNNDERASALLDCIKKMKGISMSEGEPFMFKHLYTFDEQDNNRSAETQWWLRAPCSAKSYMFYDYGKQRALYHVPMVMRSAPITESDDFDDCDTEELDRYLSEFTVYKKEGGTT